MAAPDPQCVPLKEKLSRKCVLRLTQQNDRTEVQTLLIVETSESEIPVN
jgi:hypothetical protein